jgi:hypothetical protein
VPPMLDVALQKLPAGGAKNLRSGFFRRPVNERHDILQLIAETISTA